MKDFRRPVVALMFVGAVLLCPAGASAGTVSYVFSEAGWLNMFGTIENFSGSFTGTPEANGTLALADLSSFSAIMSETNSAGETKDIARFGSGIGTGALSDFVYIPGLNSLTLQANGSPASAICLGNDVASGLCGSLPARPRPRPGAPPLPPVEGLFSFSVNGALSAYTTNLPSVNQTVGLHPVPAPATAPEPGSTVLCGGALVLVSQVLIRRNRDRARTQLPAEP